MGQAQAVLRNTLASIHEAAYYSILADETRDLSNLEQLTICIRWVDDHYAIHEDFLGLMQLPNITAHVILTALKDVLVRCNLSLARCRGQGYDGASNMSGHVNGVATKLLEEQPAAVHIHCLTHCLNLCLQDATKKFQPMRDAIDLCQEVAHFILWSPKRMQAFQHAQKEFSEEGKHTGIRPLCPNRWTVREGAIAAILQNYEALQDTFATINSECHDDYGRTAGRLLAQMEKFNTYFGLKLSHFIFGATEQLSRTLQGEDTSVGEALRATQLVQPHLERQRSDEQFNSFYAKTKSEAAEHTGEPIALPRYRSRTKETGWRYRASEVRQS